MGCVSVACMSSILMMQPGSTVKNNVPSVKLLLNHSQVTLETDNNVLINKMMFYYKHYISILYNTELSISTIPNCQNQHLQK